MYLNTLICLEENVGGYGKNQRRPSGHITLSTPGIVKAYVQDLMELADKDYILYLVSKKNNKAIRIGALNKPCENKQTTWKIDLENIEGSRICGKDIDAAAVVVEGDMIGSTDSVLVGYCKEKYLLTSMLEQVLPKKVTPTPAPITMKVQTHTTTKEVKAPIKQVEVVKPVEIKPVEVVKPIEIKPVIEVKPVEVVKPIVQAPLFDLTGMEEVDGEEVDEIELKETAAPKPVMFYTGKPETKVEDQIKEFENDPIMQKIKEALIQQIKEQMKAQDKPEDKENAKEEAKEQIEDKDKKAMEEKEKKKMAKDKRGEYLDEILGAEDQLIEQTLEETNFLEEISQRLKKMQNDTVESNTRQNERYKEIREIFERSEAIEVFDQEEDQIDWVRISMDELTAIPQLNYEWCTQPMVIFCYHKFSHFILGKDKNIEAYYVGIPDIYHATRRYILTYDRIEKFKTSSGNPISNGEYGYWIARIE